MTSVTLDPLQALVLDLLTKNPSTTEELKKRIAEAGEIIPEKRLSAILHDLRKGETIALRRQCQIFPIPRARRQVWHIPGQAA